MSQNKGFGKLVKAGLETSYLSPFLKFHTQTWYVIFLMHFLFENAKKVNFGNSQNKPGKVVKLHIWCDYKP